MPTFDYVAVNRNGKKVKASVESASIANAKASLRNAGLTLLEIKPQTVMNKDIELPFLGNPTAKDMAVFCRQFVSILRAGVSISVVLGMLAQQTANKKLCAAIRAMQAAVEKGDSLAEAMRRAGGKMFPSMMVTMVAAGEESGNLEDSFLQMETYFERIKRTKSKVGKVIIYPCVLLAVMIVVLIVMMVKIIPMFLESFREMGTELPKLTLMVMAISDWFTQWWWALILGIVVLAVAGMLFRRTDPGHHFFGWLALHIPLLKVLTEKSACSTLCRSLSVLLGSGLTLTEAMDLAAANMTNVYYREAVERVRAQITKGTPLAAAMQLEKLFPPMVCNLVGIGEETGALETMMAKVADYYDEEVNETTDKLMALMEPFIILVMAVFVVFIVLSIFLPMMSMTQSYDQYL